jgi:hypothetical protein
MESMSTAGEQKNRDTASDMEKITTTVQKCLSPSNEPQDCCRMLHNSDLGLRDENIHVLLNEI